MNNFFLISNMYPTTKYPGYGVFVKNVSDALYEFGFRGSCKAVLRGKSKGYLNKMFKYLTLYFQILIKYWRDYNFIYLHFPNQALPILYPLMKFRRRKLVINLHGEDLIYNNEGYSGKLGKLMERTCREFASAIVVPSSYFKQIVENRELIDSDKIIVSPSGGINGDIFIPKNKIFDSSRLHIGYVGRLESDKGIMEYLETCRILKNEGIGFTGVVIGYGSQYEYTKNFLIKNELIRQIRLIEGISQNQLAEFYQDMDLLIFSSSRYSESLGLTGIEAMACGTPVIGSNIGGIATYVKTSYNGWLTPVHDIEAIVKAVKDYQQMSTSDKQIMSNNCVQTGRTYYSSKVAKELALEFNKILELAN